MKNRKAVFLMSLLAMLWLTTTHFTQAQQPSGESARPTASDAPGPVVFVVGAVRSPARFVFRQTLSLTEVLTCTGGLQPDAKQQIRIFRYNPAKPEDIIVLIIDLKAIKNRHAPDPILQPYDIIEVSRKKPSFNGLDCSDCSERLKKLYQLPLRLVK